MSESPHLWIQEAIGLLSQSENRLVSDATLYFNGARGRESVTIQSKLFHNKEKLRSLGITYQCYQKNFIERFCLPAIDLAEQDRLLKEQQVDQFLRFYFSLEALPPSSHFDSELLPAAGRSPEVEFAQRKRKPLRNSPQLQAVLSF